jgi:hypothetical protein
MNGSGLIGRGARVYIMGLSEARCNATAEELGGKVGFCIPLPNDGCDR